MALNERLQTDLQDVGFGQLAPSQAQRTMFTPGVASSRRLDMNWPTDFRIPTGTPVFREAALGPAKKDFERVVKLHRNIVNDQTLPVPVVLDTVSTTITSAHEWGTVTPVSVVTVTETPPEPAVQERNVGGDMAEPNV